MEDARKILMERDGLTAREADRAISETVDLMIDRPEDAFDIIVDELGLEPDYLESILCW